MTSKNSQHCYISEKNSCASVFARSSAPDVGHNWASTSGEGSAEQGHVAPFHAPVHSNPAPLSFLLSHPVSSWRHYRPAHEGWPYHAWATAMQSRGFPQPPCWHYPISFTFPGSHSHCCHHSFPLQNLSGQKPQLPLDSTSPSYELLTPVMMGISQELSIHIANSSSPLNPCEDLALFVFRKGQEKL